MRNVLVISPYFVPINYVGAKRALHFARHLPAHGYTPAVVALPEQLDRDPALVPLVPPVPLLRCLRQGPLASLEDALAARRRPPISTAYTAQARDARAAPSRLARLMQEVTGTFAVFDRFAKHLPAALPPVLRFTRAQRCRLIYANAGPFSALLLAEAVRRATGLPMVLDLRDPWSLEPNYQASWTWAGRELVARLEAHLFRQAAHVILNTEASRAAHQAHYAQHLSPARFSTIRNSFDPALYAPPGPAPRPGDPFRIIYFGHLRPSKGAGLFLEALVAFMAAEGLAPQQVELIMQGEITPADRARFQTLNLGEVVQERPWLPFTRAPELLGQADLLLDLMGPKHHLQISGKLYDYLAVGRPILSISPNRELDALYAATGAGERVDLDVGAVVAALRRRYAQRFSTPRPAPEALAPFTAAAATAQLAAVFDAALAQEADA